VVAKGTMYVSRQPRVILSYWVSKEHFGNLESRLIGIHHFFLDLLTGE